MQNAPSRCIGIALGVLLLLFARSGGLERFALAGASLDRAGLHLRAGDGARNGLDLGLVEIGCAGHVHPTRARSVRRAGGNRVELVHQGVVEWYRSGPPGIELGFDIPQRPGCGTDLSFELAAGAFEARTDGSSVTLRDASGIDRYRISALSAIDAAGRRLPARFDIAHGRPGIRVDVSGARFPVVVDPWVATLEAQLTPKLGHGAALEGAGSSVAIDGDTAILGAPKDGAIGQQGGTAYVFLHAASGWAPQTELVPSTIAPGYEFGGAVALSGDTAAIGAQGAEGTGAVFVFVRTGTTWSEQAKLVAPDATSSIAFGDAVAISGDVAVIGADRADTTAGTQTGAVYVYERSGTTWTEKAKLAPSDGAANDYFGWSVALDSGTILVGAGGHDTANGSAAGAAYVFAGSGATWTQQAKLEATDGASGDELGVAVAVLADTALVGAVNADNSPGDYAGAAYVFVRSGTAWTQQAKLQGPTGDPARFGSSVSLQTGTALVGAPADSPGGVGAGSAYVFVGSGSSWSQQAELVEQNGADQDSFGQAVALGAGTALVGSPGFTTAAGFQAGAGFSYVKSGSSWVVDAQLDAGIAHEYAAFGTSVAVQGDTAVIGAEQEGELPAGNGVGGVYIFSRSGTDWQQVAYLSPDDGYFFGSAVGIDGGTILVGARDRDQGSITSAGGAYVYVGGGTSWAKQSVLTATDAADNDHAGSSVSINGDTALVGAPDASSSSGAAYVFLRGGTSWSQQAKLVASDAAQGDQFGGAVSVNGDTAVVGAAQHDTSAGTAAGSAYVFVRSGTAWTQQAQLVASDAGSNDQFGSSVYVSGDTAIIGAPFHDSSSAAWNTGSAYVFVRSGTTWTQQAELQASDAATDSRFGTSVSLEGAMALIGAEYADPSGEAYVFSGSGSTWTERVHFTASNGSFGHAVSLDQDTALVGAYLASVNSPDWGTVSEGVGAAYVYRIAQCSTGADCTTGFCVDGVCCDTACGGGATDDCQACSVGFGAQVDGVCGPITASAAHVCRPAAGSCDTPEVCDGGSTSCPADAFAATTTQCRAPSCSAGSETLAASCTGSSPDCPAAQTQSCGDYACGPDACLATCATDADCASGRTCDSTGACVATGTGGTGGTGGSAGSGGSSGSSAGSGGSSAGSGGTSGSSGSAGMGGTGPVDGGAGAPSRAGAGSKGGCGCELPSRRRGRGVWVFITLLLAVGLRRSRAPTREHLHASRG